MENPDLWKDYHHYVVRAYDQGYQKGLADARKEFEYMTKPNKALAEIISKATEAILRENESEAYKEFRNRGIIGEGALFVHPIHRGQIEQVLFAEGIKRVPIIYTDLIEKDKMIFTTDKELVKTARQMCGHGEEEENE